MLFSIQMNCQNDIKDTVYQLPEVKVSASRLNDFVVGLNVNNFDSSMISQYKNSSLGELLQEQSSIYIKSYGQGSLSTVSFRGTSSSQTGVFWNGFALDPPNIGIVDFSLIPVFFFQSINVQKGGVSSLYGSGSIGGSVHVNNFPEFKKNKTINVGVSAGSFQRYSGNVKTIFSNEKWNSLTGINFNKQKNNFQYENGNKTKYQENAALLNYGLIQELSRQISEKQYLKLSVWLQNTDREIPPSLTAINNDEYQIDRSVKSSISWVKNIRKGVLNFKSAFLYDYLKYVNPVADINSVIETNSSITEFDIKKYFWNNSIINIGTNYTFNSANIKDYNGIKEQNLLAVFLSFKKEIPKIKLTSNLNLRQEFIQGYEIPLIPSLGFEGKIWKFIYGKINVSKNYRAPTLNDRFWQPGGNENLKPEISWNEEASILLKFNNPDRKVERNKKNYTDFTITAYNSTIDNWIMWTPDNNFGFWTPKNLQNVWSRGIETSAKTKFNLNKINITMSGVYTYSKSTNQKKISINDNTYGKQLIYTPLHNFYVRFGMNFKKISFFYSQKYVGECYVSSDNSKSIPAYSLGKVSLGKKFQLKSCSLNLQINVDNIWDVSYQAIQFRQMPGRSYNILLTFMNGSKKT